MAGTAEIALEFDRALRAGRVRLYRKKADADIRPAIPGEVVETLIDGQRETINTAKPGDHVVRGAKGEQYIIGADSFARRYGAPLTAPSADGYQRYSAKGSLHAFRYEGEPIRFTAPWGEDMIANPGDYIGTDVPGSGRFYRVEKNVFDATYEAAPD